jgi:hypothetical protein
MTPGAPYPEPVNRVPRWLMPAVLALLVLVVLVGAIVH